VRLEAVVLATVIFQGLGMELAASEAGPTSCPILTDAYANGFSHHFHFVQTNILRSQPILVPIPDIFDEAFDPLQGSME
jgi:hypothetical protein